MPPVRRSLADQLDPLVSLREELGRRWELDFDVERARARMLAGQIGFDPLEVIGSAGELVVPFVRVIGALESVGLASHDDAVSARQRGVGVISLITAWLGGERLPADPVKKLARRAAAVLGNSVLKRAAAEVREGLEDRLPPWAHGHCPCCGSAPDFVLGGSSRRRLLCARCDTTWQTSRRGCLSCGAHEAPALAEIAAPAIGYALTFCNVCGRYLKARRSSARALDPLVERVLTAQLDAAAEHRGLRL